MLQHRQSAPCHLDTARGIQRRFGRNPIAPAHQENLQQFGSLIRIDHAALQQIAAQGCQFGRRKSVFIDCFTAMFIAFSNMAVITSDSDLPTTIAY